MLQCMLYIGLAVGVNLPVFVLTSHQNHSNSVRFPSLYFSSRFNLFIYSMAKASVAWRYGTNKLRWLKKDKRKRTKKKNRVNLTKGKPWQEFSCRRYCIAMEERTSATATSWSTTVGSLCIRGMCACIRLSALVSSLSMNKFCTMYFTHSFENNAFGSRHSRSRPHPSTRCRGSGISFSIKIYLEEKDTLACSGTVASRSWDGMRCLSWHERRLECCGEETFSGSRCSQAAKQSGCFNLVFSFK